MALAPELKISGSVNSWMPPIVEMTLTKIRVGLSIGTVIDQNCRMLDAPSSAAASYSTAGTACSAARKINALYPVQRQSTIVEIANQDDHRFSCQVIGFDADMAERPVDQPEVAGEQQREDDADRGDRRDVGKQDAHPPQRRRPQPLVEGVRQHQGEEDLRHRRQDEDAEGVAGGVPEVLVVRTASV